MKDKKNVRMRFARLITGMSQEELSKATGITPCAISLIENGKREIKIGNAIKICKALNCTLDELFWEDDTFFNRKFRNTNP